MTRLPDFVVIGAMKCGTSSLQEQLDISQLAFSAPQAPAVGAGDGAGGRYSLF